ncbi:hypothetical protein LXL04_019330 [Taraxacum kok-saghyz]
MPSKTPNISSHPSLQLGGGESATQGGYVQALEASIAKNFKDNGCIACMCHNTDGLYCAKQTALIDASTLPNHRFTCVFLLTTSLRFHHRHL